MKYKHLLAASLFITSGSLFAHPTGKKPLPYQNPKLSVDERMEDLIKRMTLEEKVYQMSALRLGEGDEIFETSGNYSMDDIRRKFGKHGVGYLSCPTTDMTARNAVVTGNQIQKIAIEETRLGIPVIIDAEALHGCRATGATSYPQSIALSCTWNVDLMAQIADAIGQETYSRGINQVLSPTLDLARDPRHGRMEECYGEDPFLASRMGVEFIKGVQKHGVICSPKHFLANFVNDGGRDSGNAGMSERELREIHMPPFRAAVEEAGVKSLMAAYNSVDGVPCSANRWLLTDVLRGEWGFDGFVVSDWSAVNHAHAHLRIAPTPLETAALCAKAGMDVELPRLKWYAKLTDMIKEGKITEEDINTNVRHILRVKFQMGLFEHPYVDEKLAEKLCDAPQFRNLAREAARQSIVLLKNEKNQLPLNGVHKLAVVGPNATVAQLGGYSAKGVKGVSPLKGIKNIFGKQVEVSYAKGCGLTGNDTSGFADAVKCVQDADACVMVMGGANWTTGGETRDRNSLDLMGVQEELILEISKTGKPLIVVLVEGRPVTMTRWMDKADAIVMMFFAGEEGGNALAEILSGKVNPSGKLTVSYPRTVGDLPMCLLHRPYGREGNVVEYGQNAMPASRYFPLYPFGYGLSYTTYEYKNLRLAKDKLTKDEEIRFSIDITNTGNMDGDETVQVYLTDLYCRITQSEKQLKAFQRMHVPAGQTKTVSFTLPYSALSFLNERLQPEVEAGEFELLVGPNCMQGATQRFAVQL
ncbi:glycoside hydrolase family 3 N-terminal domain-containing protein [uncultured Bacteroides sp.]|jgi:beta-glucosidase|uniref:glycoside hydrolase family 3 N-terminal domain-containing protein n=1 Tax=uncultured Bacteroides sp. TaxID=162156 RepID=UPI0025871F9C|nr:glycoside hydrolase family 3 N-terminal domain-containing protein [uncultured Bacteroides sp.]